MRVLQPIRPSRFTRTAALLSSVPLVALASTMCIPAAEDPITGECAVVPEAQLDCRAEGYEEGVPLPTGLVGYSCTGTSRPDLDAIFNEGVPEGILCADKGVQADSSHGYCCTPERVTCAYNPLILCAEDESGYECLGTNRPESLNAAIHCSNGNRDGEVVEYCCAGHVREPDCWRWEQIPCGGSDGGGSRELAGFRCEGDGLPRGENLEKNKSRADFFYQMCTVPAAAENLEDTWDYCCFMPPLVPPGGTCVGHTSVPGCAPGRFGFACYGPDTPEDDFSIMTCPEPGFEGISAEGYPATLYCCDYNLGAPPEL